MLQAAIESLAMPPTVVAETVSLQSLCSLLERLGELYRQRRTGKAKLQRDCLCKFIALWRQEHHKLHTQLGDLQSTDDSFYPVLRLILPSFDKERGPYGFKEDRLAKKLIDAYNLAPAGSDARTLKNYHAPHSKSADVGDFGQTAAAVLRSRLPASGKLTIAQVNEVLDEIVLANAEADQQQVNRKLERLVRDVNGLQLKWLVRILLKQMKIGMSEAAVFGAFHPHAAKLYDVSSSLKQVAQKLHDPNVTLDEIEIALWQPFRPMLAAKLAPEKVPPLMGHQPFYVETKYDGERVQLHKQADKYMYFSRNGNDWTASYGASATDMTGSITAHIHNAFSSTVESCILDAEMVGWNPIAECIATKGDGFDVKSLRPGDDLQPCLVVFDCLMLNGQVLSGRQLSERLHILHSQVVASQLPGRLMLAQHNTCSTQQDLVDELNTAIEAREEGIVVKRQDSTYQLNTRSADAGWIKVKPDYIDALCDDLDLCIVGGYWGDGRRAHILSHFLLALAEPAQPDGAGRPSRWRTVCKVGSGCKLQELWQLNQHLKQQAGCLSVARKAQTPDWLIATGCEHPDVYIRPEHSRLLQIRAAEITASQSYAAGYTLRFPRVQAVRQDKDWHQAMTTAEFDQLRRDCAGKMQHKQLAPVEYDGDGVAESGSPAKKRKLNNTRRAAVATLPAHQVAAAGGKLEADVFGGKELCVMCHNSSLKRQLIERAQALGAKHVMNAGASTWCIVTDNGGTAAVKNKIKALDIAVAKHSWLLACAAHTAHIPWCPTDLYHVPDAYASQFSAAFDAFGDSYTEPVTANQLRVVINNVDKKVKPNSTERRLSDEDLDALDCDGLLLRGARIYADTNLVVRTPEEAEATVPVNAGSLAFHLVLAREFGAQVSPVLDEQCTHVLMSDTDLSRLWTLKELNRQRAPNRFHLVDASWVEESVRLRRRLDERAFHPMTMEWNSRDHQV